MPKDIKKIKKSSSWFSETIETPPTEIIEENVYIEEYFIKNKELIRMDMNLIQFPIFSKNTRRKANSIVKYYFNKSRNISLFVIPSAGDYIPGETEEKVFIALMQIMKEKGMERKIVISSVELKNKLKINSTRYNDIIKNALSRLGSTNYVFNNAFYSNELGSVIGKKIETSIFNITTIFLEDKQNSKYRKDFEDKRIKTVYEIEFSEHFYNNIIRKGYLVYNGNTLLEIESSTARTIYMLIEKLRYSKLYLKIDIIFLIKRIPLKYDKKNIARTINTLKNAFEELKDRNLIENFEFIKETTWENSEVEIFFPESLLLERQQMFFDERNDFEKIKKLDDFTVVDMEHETLKEKKKLKKEEIEEIEEITPIEIVYNPDIDKAKEYYNNLLEDEKTDIEKIVEEQYYKKCGQRSKVQMLAFKQSKNSLIIEYITENKLYEKLKKVEAVEEELNIEELKIYIEDSIKITCSLIDLDENALNKLKLNIFKDIRPLLVKKILTTDEIDKIINKYTDELITY